MQYTNAPVSRHTHTHMHLSARVCSRTCASSTRMMSYGLPLLAVSCLPVRTMSCTKAFRYLDQHKCTPHSTAQHSATQWRLLRLRPTSHPAGMWITLTSAQCHSSVSKPTQTHAEACSTAPPKRPVCSHQLKSTVNCVNRLARNASHSCCVASTASSAVRPSYRCVLAFLLRARHTHTHTHRLTALVTALKIRTGTPMLC